MSKRYKITGEGQEMGGGRIEASIKLEEIGGIEKEWFPTSPNMPDISSLHPNIRPFAVALWGTYHLPYGSGPGQTLWKAHEAIRNHALKVFKMTPDQINGMMYIFETGKPPT